MQIIWHMCLHHTQRFKPGTPEKLNRDISASRPSSPLPHLLPSPPTSSPLPPPPTSSPLPEKLRSRQFWRAVLAEVLGTLVLVSTMLGASVPGPGEAPGGPLYPALAIAAVITSLGHCFGEISGAQVT